MTKEEWLTVRSQEELSIRVLFDFYREKGGYINNVMEFQDYLFKTCLLNHMIVHKNGEDRFYRVTHETIIHKVINYYNTKFSV